MVYRVMYFQSQGWLDIHFYPLVLKYMYLHSTHCKVYIIIINFLTVLAKNQMIQMKNWVKFESRSWENKHGIYHSFFHLGLHTLYNLIYITLILTWVLTSLMVIIYKFSCMECKHFPGKRSMKMYYLICHLRHSFFHLGRQVSLFTVHVMWYLNRK